MKRLLSITTSLIVCMTLSGTALACGGGLEYEPNGEVNYRDSYPDPQLSQLGGALRSDDVGFAAWLIEQMPIEDLMANEGGVLLHRHLMISTWEGSYTLQQPVDDKKLRVLDAMLQAGADPNAVGLAGHTPLMSLALRGEDSPMGARQVDLLIEHGAEVDATAPGGVTALQVALYANARHIAAALLRHGADPAFEDDDGASANSLAQQRGLQDAAAFAPAQQEARLKQP